MVPQKDDYNRLVSVSPLSLDTSPDIERRQVDAWRQMSMEQKAAMVTALTAAAIDLAQAGVRHRHGGESAEAQRRRLAEVLLGPVLARQAFPEPTDVP